jgi:hypothetical protein
LPAGVTGDLWLAFSSEAFCLSSAISSDAAAVRAATLDW